ncbi:MAG: LytTR family DNA-binding domain-containing protein [Bacteroidota bacterium]
MLKSILIDDEPKCLDSLRLDLQDHCPQVIIVAKCQSGKEGLKAIKKYKPDLVFLDIEMPWMNGFEMLELVDNIEFDVVFTTAYDQFAVKAFRMSAVDYLLKPIDAEDLQNAVQKVVEKNHPAFSKQQLEVLVNNMSSQTPSQRVALPVKEGFDFILVKDILYCEADGSYTKVFLSNKKSMYIVRSLKEMEALVIDHPFCRIHHSYLINLNHTVKYIRGDGGYVIMVDGANLNVSRNRKEALMAMIR